MASQTFDFYQKYTNILLLNCIDAENGSCKIWTGAIQRKRNYMLGMLNVAYPNGKRTKMNVARLPKMLQLKTIDIDRNLDASHLCHNALCVNADHIIFEPHDLNNHRKVCVASQKCTTHELHGTTYPNCMLHLKLWFVIFLILKLSLPEVTTAHFIMHESFTQIQVSYTAKKNENGIKALPLTLQDTETNMHVY